MYYKYSAINAIMQCQTEEKIKELQKDAGNRGKAAGQAVE